MLTTDAIIAAIDSVPDPPPCLCADMESRPVRWPSGGHRVPLCEVVPGAGVDRFPFDDTTADYGPARVAFALLVWAVLRRAEMEDSDVGE
jgi:hypothetical protein